MAQFWGRAVVMWGLIVLAVLLQSPFVQASESAPPQGRSASAAIDLKVVIPLMLKILENSHPQTLVFPGASRTRSSVSQKIVLLSTLRSGFCMDLRLAAVEVATWQLHANGHPGVRIEASDGGYRVCTHRPGRYEVVFEHDFLLKAPLTTVAAVDTVLSWPVHVSLATP